MNCVDLYVRKYPSDPDPSRSRKKKLPLIQHIVESWQYKLTEQQRKLQYGAFIYIKMTLEKKLQPTLLWMTHINMSQFDNYTLDFPLKKIVNKKYSQRLHCVVIHSFHVRTVFTRRKKCLTSQAAMLFNVFHALWVPLFSISLAFLKKAKKKNCERAKKQISDRTKDFL